jgi:hypothetical protein
MQDAFETYWIQRADHTSLHGSDPISLAGAQSLLRDHDWKAELDYWDSLVAAEKDCTEPSIGFSTATDLRLYILPGRDGTAQCIFADDGKHRTWERDSASLAEQDHILELFYRGDYSSLTRGWKEAEMEAPADLRDEWLEQLKASRARRGQPPELTEEERNLAETDALELHLREAQLEDEERRREADIKAARLGRNLGLILFAGGALLASLLYAGVLQDWISERFRTELWAYSTMMIALGLATGGLLHLELRARLLVTERARRQVVAAKVFCGTVMFLGSAVAIAVILTFFLTLLVPWLSDRLPQGLANLIAPLQNERGFLEVSGVLLIIIGLTIGAAFVWRQSWKPSEPRLTAISAASGICLGSFGSLAIGPFILMLPVFAAAMLLMALGFTGAEAWLHRNFAFVSMLMLPVVGVLMAAAYLYGRRRAPQWEDKTSTLISAVMNVIGIYMFGSFGMLFVCTIVAALKANGMLG